MDFWNTLMLLMTPLVAVSAYYTVEVLFWCFCWAFCKVDEIIQERGR